jgi:hypothetical protein
MIRPGLTYKERALLQHILFMATVPELHIMLSDIQKELEKRDTNGSIS